MKTRFKTFVATVLPFKTINKRPNDTLITCCVRQWSEETIKYNTYHEWLSTKKGRNDTLPSINDKEERQWHISDCEWHRREKMTYCTKWITEKRGNDILPKVNDREDTLPIVSSKDEREWRIAHRERQGIEGMTHCPSQIIKGKGNGKNWKENFKSAAN